MYRQDFRGLLEGVGAVGDPGHVRRRVDEFAATGIDEVILCPAVAPAELDQQLRILADILLRPAAGERAL